MKYICEKCNKDFNRKYNYIQHLNRKIPCNRIIKCDNCLVIFKTKQILNNHLKRKIPCKKVNLEEEVKELKEQIKEKVFK